MSMFKLASLDEILANVWHCGFTHGARDVLEHCGGDDEAEL